MRNKSCLQTPTVFWVGGGTISLSSLMPIPNVEVHRQYAVRGTIFGIFLFEQGKYAYKKH
jgi:hypothetical protein